MHHQHSRCCQANWHWVSVISVLFEHHANFSSAPLKPTWPSSAVSPMFTGAANANNAGAFIAGAGALAALLL
jgi:hypothetical protein